MTLLQESLPLTPSLHALLLPPSVRGQTRRTRPAPAGAERAATERLLFGSIRDSEEPEDFRAYLLFLKKQEDGGTTSSGVPSARWSTH